MRVDLGLGLFVHSWWVIAFDGNTGEIPLIGHIYRGYSISPLGSIVGLVWGFVDALIAVRYSPGFIIFWASAGLKSFVAFQAHTE